MPFRIPTYAHWPQVIPDATEISDGLMSAADKVKLDGLAPGGTGQVGIATFTSGGSGAGHEFVDVVLLAPLIDANYNISLGVVIDNDVDGNVTATARSPTINGFRIRIDAAVNCQVRWRVQG